jgi:4-diphosphocytidyl-2-C-methyl-D-erythritol kinase
MPSTHAATWYSPAKVNLCLRIVGRRADGYHLLDSIFATIDLCDRIDVSVEPASGSASEVVVRCDDPAIPSDASNLASRAATALLASCGVAARVTIDIAKRIPAGGGLGGGSSNAATVLRALTQLLNLDVAPDRLAEVALGLGADVPFFLTGGCARVRGIGEQVERVAGWPGMRLAIVMPPVAVSTAWAFGAYPSDRLRGGPEAELLVSGHPVDAATMVNDLEHVVLPEFPPIARAKERLLAAGATAAVMSGSGSAVVGVVPDEPAGRAIEFEFGSRTDDRTRVRLVQVLPDGPSVG